MPRRSEDEQLFELFESVDHEVPDVDPQDLMQRATTGSRPALMRWVATVVLTFAAAGAAYAAPGSPVPRWIDAITGSSNRAIVPTTEEVDPSGIVVAPGEGISVVLPSGIEGTVTFTLADESMLGVQALNGHAVFDSRPSRVEVQSPGPADFMISIPRGASQIVVLVEGESVFSLSEGQVSTRASHTAPDLYVLEFAAIR